MDDKFALVCDQYNIKCKCHEEFIAGFKLASLEDIQTLGYTNTWMRYLNGDAEITVTPSELDATLGFKIVKRKTIIFRLDLHFYD
jgi:hypothetical protein